MAAATAVAVPGEMTLTAGVMTETGTVLITGMITWDFVLHVERSSEIYGVSVLQKRKKFCLDMMKIRAEQVFLS